MGKLCCIAISGNSKKLYFSADRIVSTQNLIFGFKAYEKTDEL